MSDWKTHDVAMVTARWIRTEDHSDRRAVRVSSGWTSRAGIHVADWEVSKVRPLVVIDPEDREQVEKVVRAWMGAAGNSAFGTLPTDVDYMQKALREFANPTPSKPDEPKGLGAVVEDVDGHRFTRGRRVANQWTREDGDYTNRAGPWFRYDEIAAVRVLSQGVATNEGTADA